MPSIPSFNELKQKYLSLGWHRFTAQKAAHLERRILELNAYALVVRDQAYKAECIAELKRHEELLSILIHVNM